MTPKIIFKFLIFQSAYRYVHDIKDDTKYKNLFLKTFQYSNLICNIPGLTVVVFDIQIGQSRKRFGTSYFPLSLQNTSKTLEGPYINNVFKNVSEYYFSIILNVFW